MDKLLQRLRAAAKALTTALLTRAILLAVLIALVEFDLISPGTLGIVLPHLLMG